MKYFQIANIRSLLVKRWIQLKTKTIDGVSAVKQSFQNDMSFVDRDYNRFGKRMIQETKVELKKEFNRLTVHYDVTENPLSPEEAVAIMERMLQRAVVERRTLGLHILNQRAINNYVKKYTIRLSNIYSLWLDMQFKQRKSQLEKESFEYHKKLADNIYSKNKEQIDKHFKLTFLRKASKSGEKDDGK